MTIQTATSAPRLRLLDGGRVSGQPATLRLTAPPPPCFTAPELAAELAELYALALIRDVPFEALNDPHHVVRIDRTTSFTLHELLCELRSLSWFDGQVSCGGDPSRSDPVGALVTAAASGSRAAEGDADHRRGLKLNGDGQLTLRTLFRGNVGRRGVEMRLSAFHDEDRARPAASGDRSQPDPEAPMSHWIDWLGQTFGAGLALPGDGGSAGAKIATPRALVTRVGQSPTGRTHFNAALLLLARGMALDTGLEGVGNVRPISAQGVLSIMAETIERATGLVMSRQAARDRLSRPGVYAARLTAMAARDHGGEPFDQMRAALDELTTLAPRLVAWISVLNAREGRAPIGGEMLLLPPMSTADLPLHRTDSAAQAVIAGALSTVLKAVFDTRRHARLRMVGVQGGGLDVAAEADRLASDVAMARAVTGGWFPAENHQDLRLGEALAIHVLRGRMELMGRSLSLGFTDFDRREVSIDAHPQGLGAGRATLRVSGRISSWPLEANRSAAHLAVI